MTKKVEEDKSFRSQKTQQNTQGKKQNPMSLYVANSTPKATKTPSA